MDGALGYARRLDVGRRSTDEKGEEMNDVRMRGAGAVARRGWRLRETIVAVTCLGIIAGASIAQAQVDTELRTRRVSVANDGSQLGRRSLSGSISADGRLVAFESKSSKVVPGDDNGVTDVFVRDRLNGTTELVSVSTSGELGNDGSFGPSISPAGRYVAFGSVASNLAPGDDNGLLDVYLRDLQTGTTELISVSSSGEVGNAESFSADVSVDGRYVAFASWSSNLDPSDGFDGSDIFVRDRVTGTTEIVSITSTEEPANLTSFAPSISGDGRFVAFDSDADNLDEDDDNLWADVFVRDRSLGTTELVSVNSAGVTGRKGGVDPEITPDGRYVAFSTQSKLVPEDTNRVIDAYVHDLQTGETTLASFGFAAPGDGESFATGISDDGRFISISSSATNLVRHDTNADWDYFRVDVQAGRTLRASVSSAAEQAEGDKGVYIRSSISGDGRFVVFESSASNLVRMDTNGVYDVFVRGPYQVVA